MTSPLPTPELPERYFSCSELGRIFGVTSYTIRMWIKDGVFEGKEFMLRGKWRVPESAVKKLAEKKYGEQS